jgi:Family of unknown function (DUF5677)
MIATVSDEQNQQTINESRKTDSRFREFALRLVDTGYRILDAAIIEIGPRGPSDVKLLAWALLARNLLHVRGIVALADLGLVTEARILARNCFENSFWIAGLAEDGDKFADRMLQDEMHNRQRHGESLLADEASRAGLGETGAKLQAWLREAKKNYSTARPLHPKAVVSNTDISSSYTFYQHLSWTAAHPSVQALSRHVLGSNQGDIRELAMEPPSTLNEEDDALEMSIVAQIGVLVGTNQILGPTPPGEELRLLLDDWTKLQGRDQHLREQSKEQL